MRPHSVWVVLGSPAVGVGDGLAGWLGLAVAAGDTLVATDMDGLAPVRDDAVGAPVAGPQPAVPTVSTIASAIAGTTARIVTGRLAA